MELINGNRMTSYRKMALEGTLYDFFAFIYEDMPYIICLQPNITSGGSDIGIYANAEIEEE